jgi:putative transposase
VVQTCLLHLIRNTFRFASRRDWDAMAKDLRPVYTAVNADQAAVRLEEFLDTWGGQYPAIAGLWRSAWSGSSDALPRRSPLRTGRASYPRIRLKQAHWRRGMVQSGRCVAQPCGRRGRAQGVKRGDRVTVRVAGRR